MPVTRLQRAVAEHSKLEKKAGQESACETNAYDKLPDELLLKVTIRLLQVTSLLLLQACLFARHDPMREEFSNALPTPCTPCASNRITGCL